MKDKKILILLGTRPEAIKLAPLIRQLKKAKRFRVKVIATAQHRGMLDDVLSLFKIRPHHDLNIMRVGQNPFDVTQKILGELQPILIKEKPELIIVQGDTTTAFAGSLAAFYLKIPVAHIEAGLRTNDKYRPFPEEINRRLISAIADWHFAPTQTAQKSLRKEGVPAKNIAVTGNTVVDALNYILKRKKSFRSAFLKRFVNQHKKFVLITMHRRESFDAGMKQVFSALKRISKQEKDVHFIYPVHLNPIVRKQAKRYISGVPNIHLIQPLSYDEFILLMKRAHFMITDSGGIQEEICALKKPALVTREVTERPEAVEAGYAKLVGYDGKKIQREIKKLLHNQTYYNNKHTKKNPYGKGDAAIKIVRLLKRKFR